MYLHFENDAIFLSELHEIYYSLPSAPLVNPIYFSHSYCIYCIDSRQIMTKTDINWTIGWTCRNGQCRASKSLFTDLKRYLRTMMYFVSPKICHNTIPIIQQPVPQNIQQITIALEFREFIEEFHRMNTLTLPHVDTS